MTNYKEIISLAVLGIGKQDITEPYQHSRNTAQMYSMYSVAILNLRGTHAQCTEEHTQPAAYTLKKFRSEKTN